MVDVTKDYPGPPPVRALSSCDLAVFEGELLVVTGRSGSGKSTLLNILGLLDGPTSGSLRIDGAETANLNERERAGLRGSTIGFVFQAFHLVEHRTVTDNVALPLVYARCRRADRTRIALDALGLVEMSHRADALATQLSGGERQRVAIARALVQTPRLLLCDEPTGNLDNQTSDVILTLLADLNRSGVTIVLITHDETAMTYGSRRVHLHDGRVQPDRTS